MPPRKSPWKKIQKALQSPFHLWLLVMSLCALLSLLITVLTNGEWLASALYRQGKNFIADYSMHVLYAQQPAELYGLSAHASFPPLAYALYTLLYRVSPLPAQADIAVGVVPASYPAMLVHFVYIALLCSVFTLLLRRFLRDTPLWKAGLCTILVLVSNVFIVGILERGNSAWLALVLLMAALLLRDSPSKARREAALFCIAIAAGFKLYPALFGLLYFKEKRYPEALRLLLYGLALFFLPFFFFGGMDAIGQFFQNQSIIHIAASKWTVGSASVRAVSSALGVFGLTLPPAAISVVRQSAFLLFIVISLMLFWSVRSQPLWKDILLLVGIMVLAPSWSGVYTFPYFLLPMLLLFGNQEKEKSPISRVYALFFAGVFVSLLVFSYGAVEWIAALSAYALVFLVWSERARKFRLRRGNPPADGDGNV